MRDVVLPILIVAAGYSFGSLPTGYLIGRHCGLDIRRVGDGNVGMMNVYRSIGPGWGYLCFLVDLGKGTLAVAIARAIDGGDATAMAAGAAALVGHRYPVWLAFEGGRSAATACGVVLGIAPLGAIGPLALGVALIAWTKNSILALGGGFAVLLVVLLLRRTEPAIVVYAIAVPVYAGLNDALDRRRRAAIAAGPPG